MDGWAGVQSCLLCIAKYINIVPNMHCIFNYACIGHVFKRVLNSAILARSTQNANINTRKYKFIKINWLTINDIFNCIKEFAKINTF